MGQRLARYLQFCDPFIQRRHAGQSQPARARSIIGRVKFQQLANLRQRETRRLPT